MGVPTPSYDAQNSDGGFIARIFDNLPKPFNRSPKAQAVLSFLAASPVLKYMSVKQGMLHLHSAPLTVATPEVSYFLEDYILSDLADDLRDSYGFTAAAVIGQPDGTTSALLLGFTDYVIPDGETFELHGATSPTWKFLYPFAKAMAVTEEQTRDAENAMYMPFSRGFWLDFWGDRFNVPRLPHMDDAAYVTYLLRNFRTPKVNNKAMEDLLSAQYGISASVVDSGYKEFTVALDASTMSETSADLTPLIIRIKAAGVRWKKAYVSQNVESYQAYFTNRTGGTNFANSDALSMTITLSLSEPRYGFDPSGGFILNESTLTIDSISSYRALVESKAEMFYNDRNDPSYTVL